MSDKLYIVVPCYNEQEVLMETAVRLKSKLAVLLEKGLISDKSRILFVNDGSRDDTWKLIRKLCEEDERFAGVNLSRNQGHQNALLAGLMTAKEYADIVISMDADLQDDIDAVDEMIEKYREGCDVVYGVRNKRTTDSAFKRITAEMFYKMIKFMGANIIENHADYRLMSKRALEGLSSFHEVNLFLRGMIPMIGYESAMVYYERAERFAGESKYPLKKMLSFALEGITSLTVEPIRFITKLGLTISFISVLMILWILYRYIFFDTVPGWSSLIISVWFIGGLVLLAVGTIGEYIGKIYLETKHRPPYIVSEFIHDKKKSSD